jgi:hypothetical protein
MEGTRQRLAAYMGQRYDGVDPQNERKGTAHRVLLYMWWEERNRWREEGRRRTAAEVAYITAAQADRFQKTEGRGVLSDLCQSSRWRKPEPGVLKMNSDGAFDSSKKEGGWGFAIRDDQGQAVASGAGQEEHLLDAFHAKVLGCLAGLQAAIRLGIMRIIIEVLGRVADRFLPLFSHCGC